MERKTLRALTLAFLVCNTARAVPLEAYGRLPLYEDVALSPDGSHAAFVTTVGNECQVIIQDLANPSDSRASASGRSQIARAAVGGAGPRSDYDFTNI